VKSNFTLPTLEVGTIWDSKASPEQANATEATKHFAVQTIRLMTSLLIVTGLAAAAPARVMK
jgi:hypothetical protein